MKKNEHWPSSRVVNSQPRYCPTCGMDRPLMRFIVAQAMGEGFVAGLAVVLFLLYVFPMGLVP